MMVKQLAISLFGTPEIYVNGVAVTNWPSRAAEAVIAYVALAAQPVPRSTLIDLIWPESEPQQAASNLRTILTRIRRELGDALLVDRKTVGMVDDAAVDVLQFAELVQRGATAAQLVAAAQLYRGEFLAGFQLRGGYPFEEWAMLERERWRQQYSTLLERLVAHYLATGQFAAGEPYAREWVGVDPYDEQATQQLMWLQLRQGKRAAALHSYERLAKRLADDLAVEPLATTQAVWQRAKQAGQLGQHNLPALRSAFIGRSQEIATLTQQLSDPNTRLITLLGMGGMGKTRLAQALGRQIIRDKPGLFLDGIWFITLVAVENLDALLNRIIDSMQISVRTQRPVHEQLEAYLSTREMLLIFDNFEQLVGLDAAVQWVAKLLAAAPNVKLLITSREQLNLYEEQLVYLQGLPTEESANTPAVALFLQQAARQHVVLDAQAYRPILEICRWLDGVPLAIELAASWVRQLSPADIQATIERNQDLLQTRFRNVPARQRSLRAVFEHSWVLLSAEQQSRFAKLAYFPDSFDATAAEAVVSADVADLQELVGKSLLQPVGDQRFSIHPLLREYGLEMLEQRAQVAENHANYYLHWLVVEYRQLLETGNDTIQADVPNIRLAWSVGAAADVQAAAATAIGYYWRLRGWYAEDVALLEPFTEADNRLLRIRAINEVADAYHRLGDYDASAGWYECARTLTVGEISAERARTLEGSGSVEMRRKAIQRAVDYLEEAVAMRRQLGNAAHLAGALGMLVQAKSYNGEPDDTLFAEALSLPTYPLIRVNLLAQAGRDQIATGQYEAALATFAECERLHNQLNYPPGVASALLNYAIAATYLKRWRAAEEKLSVALVWFEGNDEKFGTGLIYLHRGMVQEGLDDLPAAYAHYLAATHVFETMSSAFGLGLASSYLAGAYAQLGHNDGLQMLQTAFIRLYEADSPALFSSHLSPIAVGLHHLGHIEAAIRLCAFALQPTYTEAVARQRMETLCAGWRETTADFEQQFALGARLSAKQLVEQIAAL